MREDRFFEDEEYSEEYNKTSPFAPMELEDCFQISAGNFGRGLLLPDRNKFGTATAWNIRTFKPVEYEIIPGDEPTLFIQYDAKKSRQYQEIYIDTTQTKFGQKPYLLCKCGHRGKLYLRPDAYFWSCRKCLNLRYVLTMFNKQSLLGSLAYQLNQCLKIELLRAKLRREIYNGSLTRKAISIMKKTAKLRMSELIKA